jgi:5-methylthioadenosine/S-adenosylhomocysteine deaminase
VDAVATTPCDFLLDDVLVLSPGAEPVPGGAVAVDGDRIAAVGPAQRLRAAWSPGRTLHGGGGILLPGLVNSHNHSPLMVVRGMVEDRGFAPAYLAGVPQGDALSQEEALALARLGVFEALAAGSTTQVDYYRHPAVLAQAAEEIGTRAVVCGRIMDVSSGGLAGGTRRHDPAVGELMLRESLDLIDAWDGAAGGRIRCDLAPHAPDTCSPALLAAVSQKAARRGKRLHTHLCQSALEVDYVRERDGHGPVEALQTAGMLHERLVAAHCIHMDETDVARAGAAGIAVAHSPIGNLASGRAAPILDLEGAGARITLCTDTKSGDLFEAMRAAIASARMRGAGYEPKAEKVLRWATVSGAEALGLDEEVGRIAPGLKADLVLLHARHPNLAPVIDGTGIVVHSAHGGNVRHVLVDGRLLIEDGRAVAFDGDAIVADAQAVAARLWARHGTPSLASNA